MAASPHVLVVDGSLADCLLVSKFLKSFRIRVTSVEGPLQALSLLNKEHDVTLILSDYNTPDMTGYGLLLELKDSPDLKDIPVVIAFTDYTPDDVKKCLDAGARDYVLKPIVEADMPRILNHI